MAFRRQDIPKTTRKGDEGKPRRIYPRFAKDRALLPKIELAIDYLDGMVGRRRGDLSPDVVLELFGEPKLARCILASLGDSYRYRTPTFAEIVGDETATALAGWDLAQPADLRAFTYAAANDELGGFVSDRERSAFLSAVAEPLGLSVATLSDLLYLDAERNAVLVQVGPKPIAEDVVARYNVILMLSVLRHASAIDLELPGLSALTVETVCARHEVSVRVRGRGEVTLAGRRNALGAWSTFGTKLARCALQLIMLAPRTPEGRAAIHLNDRTFDFVLNGFAIAAARPVQRAVAAADGVVRVAALADEIGALRRLGGGRTNGWTMRRANEPLVVAGGIAMPELVFTRSETAIAVVPVEDGPNRERTLAALTAVHAVRPVIALGIEADDVPSIRAGDPAGLIELLDQIDAGWARGYSPIAIVDDQIAASGWIEAPRLASVFGSTEDLAERVRPLTVDGDAIYVAGFGLCRLSLLDDLLDRVPQGPVDVGAVRRIVATTVGDGPGADALTLHLLSHHLLVATPVDATAVEERAA